MERTHASFDQQSAVNPYWSKSDLSSALAAGFEFTLHEIYGLMSSSKRFAYPVACMLDSRNHWAHSCRPESSNVSTSHGMPQRQSEQLRGIWRQCVFGLDCVIQGCVFLDVVYICAVAIAAPSHAQHEENALDVCTFLPIQNLPKKTSFAKATSIS